MNKPTVEGYYWAKQILFPNAEPEIVKVEYFDSKKIMFDVFIMGDETALDIIDFTDWEGPILRDKYIQISKQRYLLPELPPQQIDTPKKDTPDSLTVTC